MFREHRLTAHSKQAVSGRGSLTGRSSIFPAYVLDWTGMPPVLRRKGASGALTLPCVGLIGGLKKGAARAAAHGPTTMKRRQLRDTAGSLIDWLRSLRRPSKVLIVIGFDCGACILRSEEHTSELQSLM